MRTKQGVESYDNYSISYQETVCDYASKKAPLYDNSSVRIVFLAEDQLHTIKPWQPRKVKYSLKMDTSKILRMRLSKDNKLCLVFSNNTMEIRDMDKNGQVVQSFSKLEFTANKDFPKLYWEGDKVYVLSEDTLELFSIAKKERKIYRDIVTSGRNERIQNMVPTCMLDEQRLILMQFADRIVLNIVPFPVAEMPVRNVSTITTVFSPEKGPTGGQLRSEYLILVVQNRLLQVFNMVNMRQIAEIKYENPTNESISLASDANNEYLLVTFTTKKKKIVKNILYKINTKYYSASKDEKPSGRFFSFEIDLHIKQPLMLFESWTCEAEMSKFMLLQVGYFRHSDKKAKGQICLFNLLVSLALVKRALTGYTDRNDHWDEVAKWREEIELYHNMSMEIEEESPEEEETMGGINLQALEDFLVEKIKSEKKYTSLMQGSNKSVESSISSMMESGLMELIKSYLFEQKLSMSRIVAESGQTDEIRRRFYESQNQDKYLVINSLEKLGEGVDSVFKEPRLAATSHQVQHTQQHQQDCKMMPQNKSSALMEEKKQVYRHNLANIETQLKQILAPLEEKLTASLNNESIASSSLESRLHRVSALMEDKPQVDSPANRYFRGLLNQFDDNLQRGLSSYMEKNTQILEGSLENTEGVVKLMEMFIERQLQARQAIFDPSRARLQKSLQDFMASSEVCFKIFARARDFYS